MLRTLITCMCMLLSVESLELACTRLRSDLNFKYSYKETEGTLTDVDFSQRGDRIDCNTNAIADGITGPLCESVSRSEGPGMDQFGWAKQLMVGVKGSVKFYSGDLNGAMTEFTSGTDCGSKVRMALGSSFAAAVCEDAVRVYRYDGSTWTDHGEIDYSGSVAHEMNIALNHEDYLIVSVPSTSTVQIIKLGMTMEVIQMASGDGDVAAAVNCQGSVFGFVSGDNVKLKQLSQKTSEWSNLDDVPVTATSIFMSSDVLAASGTDTRIFYFTSNTYTEHKVMYKSGKVALEHDHLIVYGATSYKFDEGPSTKCLALHKLVNGVCVYCGLGYGNLDDNTDATCTDVLCAANQYVLNHECQNCLTGTSTGGPKGGNDTVCECPAGTTFNSATGACDAILCGADFRVSSNECVPCDVGEANTAGDDASGVDTGCFPFFCNPDEYVSSHVCIPCPDGGRRAETDNRSGNDTVCEPLTDCNANEYFDGTCQTCPAGTLSEVLDDSMQKLGNASCLAVLCAENERVQNNACAACPAGAVRAAGDDATGANTECACSDGYSGDGTSCTACGANEESFTHADGSKTCVCSEGSEADTTCVACTANANALSGPKTAICVVNPDALLDGACPVDCKSKTADTNNCILPFEDSVSTPCCKLLLPQECGCNENFHVMNNECVACTTGELRASGDDPDNGNTYCNTEGITLAFGNNGNDDFVYDGQNDPNVALEVGQTYTFLRDTTGHPMRILSESDVVGLVSSGLDTITWSSPTTTNLPSARIWQRSTVRGDDFIVYGGHGKDEGFVLDTSTMVWSTLGTDPGSRREHVMVTHGTDVYVHGGYGSDYLSDVWKLSASNAWSSVTTSGTAPARMGHVAVVHGDSMYVFGGSTTGFATPNTVHKLDLTTYAWSDVTTTGTGPSGRTDSSAVVYGDYMIVYGGSYNKNDVKKLNLLTYEWTSVTTTGSMTARASHQAGVIGDFMFVFGGNKEASSTVVDELWTLNLLTNEWAQHTEANAPSARQRFTMGVHNNDLLIYGTGATNSVDFHKLSVTMGIGGLQSLPTSSLTNVDSIKGTSNVVYNFKKAGTYYYVCTSHLGMFGKLIVTWPVCSMASQGSVTLSKSCRIETSITLTGALSVNTALRSSGQKLLLSMTDITAISAGTYAFILNNVELSDISSANPFATGQSITLNNVDVKGNTQTGSLFVSSGHLVAQNMNIEGPSSQIVIDGTGDVSIANVVSDGVTLVKHSAGAVVARDINITNGRLGELSDSTTVFEAILADNSDLVAVNSAVQVERSSFKTKGISFDSSTCTECKRELILSGIDFDSSQVTVVSNALNKPVVKVIEGSGADLTSDNGISLYAIDVNLTATDAIVEECLPHQCSHKPLATSCRVKAGKGTECICDVGVATYNLETQELDKQSTVEEMLSLAFATADEMDRVIKLVDRNVRYIPTQATPQSAKSNILLMKPSNTDGEMESEKTILVKPDTGVVCATFQTWLCAELDACHWANGTLTAVCDGTPIQMPQRRLRSFMKKKYRLRADANCDYNQVSNLKVPCVSGSMIYSRCVEDAYFFHDQCVCAVGLKANANGDACIDEDDLCEQNERVKDGRCVACEGLLTNKAGDVKSGSDTTCDDVICREGFYSTGNGGCLRCSAGAFNLAGDIAYDANSGNGPATTCCPSGEYEFDVDINAGTRTCKACGDGTEGIRVRYGTSGGGLSCCREERLSADAALKCGRLMDYYRKVCQPLEDTNTCPAQSYI